MARYAKTDVRIWGDEKVAKMTPIPPCGQGLWIRLLISPHRSTVPGILCVGEAALAEEFGWSLEAFREAFREASAQGMVKADWKARFVWLPNAKFYNRPESPNVVKSWRIPWDEAPECPLKVKAYRELKAFMEGFAKGFQEAFAKSCAEPLANQEQEHGRSPSSSGVPCADPEKSNGCAKVRPREAHELILCLKIAVEREQPERGMWAAEPFGHKNAQEFLRGFGDDLEAALATIEERIALFAADAAMSPWTVKKFADRYNGIGQPRTSSGQTPADPTRGHFQATSEQPKVTGRVSLP